MSVYRDMTIPDLDLCADKELLRPNPGAGTPGRSRVIGNTVRVAGNTVGGPMTRHLAWSRYETPDSGVVSHRGISLESAADNV
jgi:hypothetical protein